MLKKRAAECIVFIMTQRVAKNYCPSIGKPIAVNIKRRCGHKKLSLAVELNLNLLRRYTEHLGKTFGNVGLTNFPINTATWRDCTLGIIPNASRHAPGGCQISSFSNTQDILNIQIGSILENPRKRRSSHSARRRSIPRRRRDR